jgi:ABC-2 type transport system ATP-binding protein
MTTAALSAEALGKRYGSNWALHDCTFELPPGSVTALVGPNGAGKTTLLQLAVGLSRATTGAVRVLGRSPRDDAMVLHDVGFVAQDHPLYRGFTVEETLNLGARLNPSWDHESALDRVNSLGLPLRKKVGRLSGGQQAQVALTLALAKRPQLLLLDEPIASLDPLARREFLQSLMEAVTENGMAVVLSSHIVADLERVCDHLVILSHARPQLVGSIDAILETHRLLTGPRAETASVARTHEVIRESHTERQTTLVVRGRSHVYQANWQEHELDLEEIVLAYLGRDVSARPARSWSHEAVPA